jgi:hypothetical protein
LIAMPIFLALGFVPTWMAKANERRRQRHFAPDKSQPKLNPVKYISKILLCALILLAGTIAGAALSMLLQLEPPQFPAPMNLWSFGAYTYAAGGILSVAFAELSRWLAGNRWMRRAILAGLSFSWLGINNPIEGCIYTSMGGQLYTTVTMLLVCSFVAGAVERLFGGRESESSFSDDLRQFFASRTTAQWMLRLFAALLAFPLVYFAFGMPAGLIVAEYHHQHSYGLKLPSSMPALLAVEFLRSGFALLTALPVLAAWRGSRLRFVWTFGLSLFVVAGLYGLMQAFWMPWTMRGVHAVELLLDSLAYGWLLAALLLAPQAVRHHAVSRPNHAG